MSKTWISNVPRLVETALSLLLVWYVYSLFIPDMSRDEVLLTVEKKMHAEPPIDDALLFTTPLFGKIKPVTKTDKPVAVRPIIIKRRLDIKVLGTVVAGKSSAAIMTVGTSAQSTFFLGDSLYARVTLKAVEVDAVVIDNLGETERLALSDEIGASSGRVSQYPSHSKRSDTSIR